MRLGAYHERTVLGRWRRAIGGHVWTVLPQLRDQLRPLSPPAARPWTTTFDDPDVGVVRLHGQLHEESNASTLLLVVHGLGGDPSSVYCRRVAMLAQHYGWSCLRLGLRGSEGEGEDLYHAGVGHDLAHALGDAGLARYDRVLVLGYSLGGHLALDHALAPAARVAAIATVSAPLDLHRSGGAIDRRRAWLYRTHILRALKHGYAKVAARRSLVTPTTVIEQVRTLREWDRLAVVPRFGFDDVDDYYDRASVGPKLRGLQRPTLYLGMRHDPMIPAATVEPSLVAAASHEHLTVRWLDAGGHVFAPGSWEDQVLSWLDHHGR